MFEVIFACIISWYAIGFLSVFAIIAQLHKEESGWVFIWVASIIVIMTQLNVTVTPTHLMYGLPAYALLGILWSFWRYKRYVAEQIAQTHEVFKDFQEEDSEKYSRYMKSTITRVAPGNKITMIVHHIIFWPVSAFCNIFADIFDLVSKFVKHYMIGIYSRILNNEITKYKIEP